MSRPTGNIVKVKRSSEKNNSKVKAISDYRRLASRMASKANKRIERLEKNKLTDSPAYKQYLETGGVRFGVKGKTYNEVQAEVARLNKFIHSKTSTIKGINTTLKEMADNTGIKYESMKELREKSAKFFELSNKVEEYLRNVDDMASAIGYQKIWEAINTYTQDAEIDLSDGTADVDSMIEAVTKALKEYETADVGNDPDSTNWFYSIED